MSVVLRNLMALGCQCGMDEESLNHKMLLAFSNS